jgi:acyl-CoA thioesterase-1
MKPGRTKLAAVLIVLLIATSSFIVFFYQNSQKKVTPKIIRVACIGDSITEWSQYPATLQAMLGDDYLVENFGVAGSAVSKGSDKPYMNQIAFQQAKDFQPSVVIIMLGTNDAKEYNYRSIASFPKDYEELIGEYDALPDQQNIWIVKPPPIFKNEIGLNNTYLEQGVLPSIDQVADDMNLPTIDVNQALINHSEYFIDGVHPNSDGAELIASIINDAIGADNILNYWEY